MKLAYLLLAHKNQVQLKRLVDALDCTNTYFFIHIDKKTNIDSFIQQFDLKAKQNVFFCPKQEQVSWGGFGMILATVALLRMFETSGIDADYVVLLSGQDFPIKSNEDIFSFFKENYGRNFIENKPIYNKVIKDYRHGLYRIENWFWSEKFGINRSMQLVKWQEKLGIRRKFIKGIVPYWGSQWWSLHKECIKFILSQCNTNNKTYLFYKNSFIADEMLFQTLIMNSEFKNTVVNNNYTFIKWNRGPITCKTLTKEDLSELIQSDNIFARKFDISNDSEVIKYINIKRDKVNIKRTFEFKYKSLNH